MAGFTPREVCVDRQKLERIARSGTRLAKAARLKIRELVHADLARELGRIGPSKLTVEMPYPPSVNALRQSANGRLISTPAYRQWLTTSAWDIKARRPGRISGPYRLWLVLTPADNRPSDLGNREKAASDLLVHAGVIEDDRLAREIHLFWSGDAPIKGGRCIATVEVAA